MNAQDRLLTKEEAQAVGAKWDQWDEALAHAQDAKTLKALTEWLDNPCPHGTKAADTSAASRRECDSCWAELLAEMDALKGKETA